MKKKICILFVVMIGLLLAPSLTYACGKSSNAEKKSCCEHSSKADKKDCCKKNNSASKHKCGDDGCKGQCKNASCQCSTAQANVLFLALKPMQYNYPACIEKQFFTDAESYTLSGFSSLWLPPKIS